MSLPFALFDPSLTRYPSTVIVVPGARESFVKPRLNSTFGVPASIAHGSPVPSSCSTSTKIQTWGLVHSILVTVALNRTGNVGERMT